MSCGIFNISSYVMMFCSSSTSWLAVPLFSNNNNIINIKSPAFFIFIFFDNYIQYKAIQALKNVMSRCGILIKKL